MVEGMNDWVLLESLQWCLLAVQMSDSQLIAERTGYACEACCVEVSLHEYPLLTGVCFLFAPRLPAQPCKECDPRGLPESGALDF